VVNSEIFPQLLVWASKKLLSWDTLRFGSISFQKHWIGYRTCMPKWIEILHKRHWQIQLCWTSFLRSQSRYGLKNSIFKSITAKYFDLDTLQHDNLIDKIAEDRRYVNNHRFTNKIASKNQLKTIKSVDRAEFLRTKNASTGNYLPAYSLLCAGRDFIVSTDELGVNYLYC